MSRNDYFDYIDREGRLSAREHLDRQYDRFVPPLPESDTMTKVDRKKIKEMESAVETSFNQHGKNIQFSIMDLPAIHKAGIDAARAGESIDDAIKAAIEKYRKN